MNGQDKSIAAPWTSVHAAIRVAAARAGLSHKQVNLWALDQMGLITGIQSRNFRFRRLDRPVDIYR